MITQESSSDIARKVTKNAISAALKQKVRKREKCEESLLFFVQTMWKYVEPSTEFVETWHIEAICIHLEQVTYGNIKRLLINVPPGMMKSLLVDVFWPAWEWLHDPTHRYLCTSYSQSLTERDNIRFRNVIMSEEYQAMWGNKFGPSKDSFSVVKVANDKTGWKLATSTGGTGTGERGSRVLCFPYDELVATERGRMKIGDIVTKKIPVRVWSTNTKTKKTSLKKITAWRDNPGSEIMEATFSDGEKIKCTPRHQIWTDNRGWVEAQNLSPGDVLPRSPNFNLINKIFAHAKSFCNQFIGTSRIKNFYGLLRCDFSWYSYSMLCCSKPFCYIDPRSACTNAANSVDRYPIFFRKVFSSPAAYYYIDNIDLAKFSSRSFLMYGKSFMPFGIINILRSSTIIKIPQKVIFWIPIPMASIISFYTRANKCGHYRMMNQYSKRFAIFSGIKSKISFFSFRVFNNLRWRSIWPSIPNNQFGFTPYPSKVANTISSFKSGNRFPILIRKIGHIDRTFCLEVEDNHTFYVGHSQAILVKNCDDPHNVKDGESDLVRRSTLQYFTEVLPTRLVSPVDSAIIVIMQRVNEEDVSGYIIANQLGYVHLMLPMRFDSSRKCVTYLPGDDEIFFEDPRTEDGELLSPTRSPEWAVKRDEKVMGSYAVAGQFQQMPSPRGGGIIKDKYWKLYPDYQEILDEDGKPVVPLEYPAMEFIIASLDSAYTAKEENDYSALTVWGVWRKDGSPKVMLMAGWKERLELNALVNKVNNTCSRPKGIPVDRLLIENKASGKSVAQEIIRLFDGAQFGVEMVEPKGDKISRMHSIQHLFENGIVYAPDRAWSQMVIDDCSKFPKGAHDDIPDSLSMALSYMRNMGFMLRTDEYDTAEIESRMLSKPTLPLYDI